MILFVYGTLRRGQLNHIRAEFDIDMRRLEFLGTAKTAPQYTLVGIHPQYPALYAGGLTSVVGELYELDPECSVAKGISFMERGYTAREILLEDGRKAMAYVIDREIEPYYLDKIIASGDWCEHHKLSEKDEAYRRLLEKNATEYAHEDALEEDAGRSRRLPARP